MRNVSMQRLSMIVLAATTLSISASYIDCDYCWPYSSTSPAGMTPTFFRPRNLTTNSTFELALDAYNRYNNPRQCWGDIYIRPFYTQSFYGAQTARYFLPSGTDRMRVGYPGDVNPIWLRLIAPKNDPDQSEYNSIVAINPVRQAYGSFFTLNLYPTQNLFLNVHFALVKAIHNLRVSESARVVSGALEDFNTFCQAMNADDMLYGKMACRKIKTLGVDDVQFKLGYSFVQSDNGHFMGYLVGTAPTAKNHLYKNNPCNASPCRDSNNYNHCNEPVRGSEYMFQPLVGNLQGSFGVGVNADTCLYHCDNRSVYWLMDFKFNYYFSAVERRTFDLAQTYNKTDSNPTCVTPNNWSRYFLLVDSTATDNPFPGVNVFSVDASVRPGAQLQYWTACHADCADWHIEAGYNFWYRQQERVKIVSCYESNNATCYPTEVYPLTFPTNDGIYDIRGVIDGSPTSAQRSVIYLGEQNPSDDDFIAVELTDLNPTSAAHPRTASSTFYTSLGRSFCLTDQVAMHIGINASVELSHNYAALNQGAFWATFGLMF